MKVIITTVLLFLIGCQSTPKEKGLIAKNADNSLSEISPSALETIKQINSTLPLSVQYSHSNNPDSMFLNFNNERLYITPHGKVYKNGKLFFDIKSIDFIKEIYFLPIKEDMIVFYVYSDGDFAGSFSKRIDTNNGKILWETSIYAFNMSAPLIVGDYAYLSTLGFVGKLNLINGKYAWKFENLENRFESFIGPEFFIDSLVLFKSRSVPPDSVMIDDKNGKLLKISIRTKR